MKKQLVTLAALLLLVTAGFSQGVYISSGSNLYIGSGATVSLDSLVLKPTSSFNLTGLRREYRNSTVVHTLSRPYLRRVYHFSTTTPAYSGAISIYYRDAELNGISESALTLNVHNGTSWNAYTGGVTRNSTANYVTTIGLSSVPLNELTLAGSTSALLTQNKAAAEPEPETALVVYPNPVEVKATTQIVSPEAGNATLKLYDATGVLVQQQQLALVKGLNQLQLDMQGYAAGPYTLVVTWNDIRKTVTIVKQ